MLIATLLAYRIITKATGRQYYSRARILEHEKNRRLLLEQFNAQPVTFQTADNINLSGLLLVREGAKKTILVCHGYRMCKERLVSFATMFADDNILLFDHRGHGQSEGIRTTIGYEEKKDVHAALDFLESHQKTKRLPIFGIGISMGAVSLLGAACENQKFKALVLDSVFGELEKQARRTFADKFYLPIVSFESIAKRLFEYIMQFSLKEVNGLLCAEKNSVPTLFIHSTHDRVAALSEVQKMYELVCVKKDIWIVEASSHAKIFNDYPAEYCKHVNSFFDTLTA